MNVIPFTAPREEPKPDVETAFMGRRVDFQVWDDIGRRSARPMRRAVMDSQHLHVGFTQAMDISNIKPGQFVRIEESRDGGASWT